MNFSTIFSKAATLLSSSSNRLLSSSTRSWCIFFYIRLKVCYPAWLLNLPLPLDRRFTNCWSSRFQWGGHSHRINSWVPMQQFLHIIKERPRLAVMACLGVPLLNDFVSKIQVLIRMMCVLCLFVFLCLSFIPIQNFTIIEKGHHYFKLRPMLGTQGHWAVFKHATLTETWDTSLVELSYP